MALTLKNELNVPANIIGHRDDIAIGATGDAADFAYSFNPSRGASITVDKSAESATVFLSTTTHKKDGARITSIDDADIIWVSRSTGTDVYFVGDEKGVSFMKVIPDAGTTTGVIEISVSQF